MADTADPPPYREFRTDVLELREGPYKWSLEDYVRGWEAGLFSERVELIEGDIVYVGMTAVDDLLAPED